MLDSLEHETHAISILNNRFFYQVVLVIPYRDRAEHLSKFLEIMHPFLQHQVCSLALSNCLLSSLESIKENNFLSFEVIGLIMYLLIAYA